MYSKHNDLVSLGINTVANSGSSSDSVAIIGGAVGVVVLLLMIIVVLCVVILCMRRSHMKKEDDKITYTTSKLNTDVTMDSNPSYDVTKVDTVNYSYDTINPGGSDVPITTNPYYNVHTKPYSKTSEDDYNYVQPNELMQHSDVGGYIKINPNVDLCHGISPTQDEYGVVNQPQS